MKKRVPRNTRRLTREEAARKGVSFSSKHRVSASVKRVTAKTPTYTDRQWAEASIRARRKAAAATPKERREAAHLTKERFAASRFETYDRKKAGGGRETVRVYSGLSKAQLMKILRKNRKAVVSLSFDAVRSGRTGRPGSGNPNEHGWSTGVEAEAYDLIGPNLADYLDAMGVEDEPLEYAVRIYP